MVENIDNIWFNINRLKWANKLSNNHLSSILKTPVREVESMQFSHAPPSMDSLISFAEYFEIGLDNLVNSKISLRKTLKPNDLAIVSLPEEYSVAANSKVRTSYHIINFLEQNKKFNLIERFLDLTEVPYKIFADLDNKINIEFITKLCNWLSKNKLVSKNDLYLMGLNTYTVNKDSEMAHQLSNFRSLKDLHLFQINEFMKFFDKNAHYRVKSLSETKCVATFTHNQEVCDGLKRKRISSLEVETYQLGVAASFPLFLNLPSSKVKMLSSMHLGFKETSFEIDFSEANNILKKKQRLRLRLM